MGRTWGETPFNDAKEEYVRRPKRRRTTKTVEHLHKHVKKRAAQRFAMAITEDEILAIGELIRKRKATFIAKQSSTVTLWHVQLRGMTVSVAYDRKRKTIRTVMPKEYLVPSKERK